MTAQEFLAAVAGGQRTFLERNLGGLNLSGADLSGVRLLRCDLSNANLSGADLSRALLGGSRLHACRLAGAKLVAADLTGADLSQADLSHADMTGAVMIGAALSSGQLAAATTKNAVRSATGDWGDGFGLPAPLGAWYSEATDVYRFSLFSENATRVSLLIFGVDETNPIYRQDLDPLSNRSAHIWHAEVPAEKIATALYYAYQIEGRGSRFDPQKFLLDPYARGLKFPANFEPRQSTAQGPNAGQAILAVLPPRTEWRRVPPRFVDYTRDAVIYEMHVRGFTRSSTSGVSAAKAGTYLGVIDKIPYLLELGVTVVELMPVFQYVPEQGGNYWGYMPISFFTPHQAYASQQDAAGTETEFRTMVDAFHDAGLEVVLDVVYNHTAELGQGGPTFSFRGIDDANYYSLDQNGHYIDYSATGNGFRTGHPAVRQLILDSLRYWVQNYGVDGFRFDLAGILARNADGVLERDSATLTAITNDADLGQCRFIAEPYDAKTGAFRFPGISWQQWNNAYRDDIRRFVRGTDLNTVGPLMTRLYGSSDIFDDSLPNSARAYQSVNFADCHDGFCLWDLVSYNVSHNEANVAAGAPVAGGQLDNISSNYGFEGTVGAPANVLAFRRRQVKNFIALLMMSQGTPMFCAGDEFLRTQGGNNNPYNQDNATSWLDWTLQEQNDEHLRFVQRMISLRKSLGFFGGRQFWRNAIQWFGSNGLPDLGPTSRTIAFCLRASSYSPMPGMDLYVMASSFDQSIPFTIQIGSPGDWRRIVDTSLASPEDVAEVGFAPEINTLSYLLQPNSVVVLARPAT